MPLDPRHRSPRSRHQFGPAVGLAAASSQDRRLGLGRRNRVKATRSPLSPAPCPPLPASRARQSPLYPMPNALSPVPYPLSPGACPAAPIGSTHVRVDCPGRRRRGLAGRLSDAPRRRRGVAGRRRSHVDSNRVLDPSIRDPLSPCPRRPALVALPSAASLKRVHATSPITPLEPRDAPRACMPRPGPASPAMEPAPAPPPLATLQPRPHRLSQLRAPPAAALPLHPATCPP